MSNYAPGPWSIDEDDKYCIIAKQAGEGDIVCLAPIGFNYSMENWKANACLIAAAPDLLDALDKAIKALTWVAENYVTAVSEEELHFIENCKSMIYSLNGGSHAD